MELQIGQEATFQNLEISKGTLVPCGNSKLESSTHSGLSQVLLECNNDCAVFSRLTYLTVEMMRQLFAHDEEALLQYRQQCLPQDLTTTTTTTTSTYTTSTSTTTTTAVLESSPQTIWGGKRIKALHSETPSLPARSGAHTTQTAVSTSTSVMQSATGDVEALPYIRLALERQSHLAAEFEALLSHAAVATASYIPGPSSASSSNNSDINSSSSNCIPIVRTPLLLQRAHSTGTSSHPSGKSTAVSLYQHQSGNLVYLHPICVKCLLEASQSADLLNKTETTTVDTANTTATTNTTTVVHSNNSSSDYHTITAKILEIESVRITTDSIRQRYPILRHLPLHSEVLLIEIDLTGRVPLPIWRKYSDEIHKRAQRRKDKVKREKREKYMERDKMYVLCSIYCIF